LMGGPLVKAAVHALVKVAVAATVMVMVVMPALLIAANQPPPKHLNGRKCLILFPIAAAAAYQPGQINSR